ncbi:MAG: N-acetyltransferase [Oxalobacteraceae bacterium]|nr:MAG: N-acetyltransferase [Oxalobacteraceae bacterium]
MFPGIMMSKPELMSRLLHSSYGLGVLGYLRFYIIEVDGEEAGMVMPQFGVEPDLYSWLDHIMLIRFLRSHIGWNGVRQVLRNAKALRALQAKPGLKELRINYVAISDEHQGRGYASSVIRLLRLAYMQSSTNNCRVLMITAFVRANNTASVKLFEKARFVRQDIDADPASDPTRGTESSLIRYVLTAS